MKAFEYYNPYVILIHFIFVVGVCMLVMHPAILLTAFVSGVVYSVVLSGWKKTFFKLVAMLPVALITSCLNPIFNHSGKTVLTYLPTGSPVTFEAILYGMASGVMLMAVILWFNCFNAIFKGDKVMYVFGRLAPAVSLILTMALGFIPKLVKRAGEMIRSQRTMGRDVEKGRIKDRMAVASGIFSALVSWGLESSVETAQSMKARGYGNRGRTTYSVYSFDGCDTIFSVIIGVFITLFFTYFSGLKFAYYPVFEISGTLPVAGYYAVLCFAPSVVDLMEVIKWK